MTETMVGSYGRGYSELIDALVGQRVVSVDENRMTLSDGTLLTFYNEDDCCSWCELDQLSTTENIILSAKIDNGEDDYEEYIEPHPSYKVGIYVVTENEALNIVEAQTGEGSGYYLGGFALTVSLTR